MRFPRPWQSSPSFPAASTVPPPTECTRAPVSRALAPAPMPPEPPAQPPAHLFPYCEAPLMQPALSRSPPCLGVSQRSRKHFQCRPLLVTTKLGRTASCVVGCLLVFRVHCVLALLMGSQTFFQKKSSLPIQRFRYAHGRDPYADVALLHDLVTIEFVDEIGHQTPISNGYTTHLSFEAYVNPR